MLSLDATGATRRICPVFDREQFGERPGSWAQQADLPPIEHTRRTHIEETGSLPLACYNFLTAHAMSVPQAGTTETASSSQDLILSSRGVGG